MLCNEWSMERLVKLRERGSRNKIFIVTPRLSVVTSNGLFPNVMCGDPKSLLVTKVESLNHVFFFVKDYIYVKARPRAVADFGGSAFAVHRSSMYKKSF